MTWTIFACVIVATLIGVAIWIFWKSYSSDSGKEQESNVEKEDIRKPVFLDPKHLEISLNRGHLIFNHSTSVLPPFFHYVLENNASEFSESQMDRLSKEEEWKNSKNYLNVLWSMRDCEKIYGSPNKSCTCSPPDTKKMNLIAKFVPMMVIGGIYQSPDRPLMDEHKTQLDIIAKKDDNDKDEIPKIYLFRDPSSGKIDRNFFASTYAPKFWKNVIINILSEPSCDNDFVKILEKSININIKEKIYVIADGSRKKWTKA